LIFSTFRTASNKKGHARQHSGERSEKNHQVSNHTRHIHNHCVGVPGGPFIVLFILQCQAFRKKAVEAKGISPGRTRHKHNQVRILCPCHASRVIGRRVTVFLPFFLGTTESEELRSVSSGGHDACTDAADTHFMEDDQPPQPRQQPKVVEVPQEPHVRYSGLLMTHFSHVAPRLAHAKGTCMRAATFALPEYVPEKDELNFKRFQQTGFSIIPSEIRWLCHTHTHTHTHTSFFHDLHIPLS
jgi:hypothetical protein